MTGHALKLLVNVMALLASAATFAQPSATPPMSMAAPSSSEEPSTCAAKAEAMHMTVQEMCNVDATQPHEGHAPDPALERPALSQQFSPPAMNGMDSDMNDAGFHHDVWFENLEGVYGAHNGGAWDAQAWLGGDFDKLWLKSEGATLGGKTQDAKIEALWAHAILPFWDTQVGVRDDFSGGPSRQWAAVGVQGISPYWFDVELTGYVGDSGRTAVRLKTEYDLYLTERLILKPEIELNAYGRPDRARNLGAGLSDGEFELRLRYAFTRRFAPYVGYVFDRRFAGTATLNRKVGSPETDNRGVAGLEFFF